MYLQKNILKNIYLIIAYFIQGGYYGALLNMEQ